MIVAGMAVFPVTNAFAHTFSQDENAGFISLVEQLRVHLQLVKDNLSSNMEMAAEHAKHTAMHLDEHVIAEIAEKNVRISEDLPAAIDDLNKLVESGSDEETITAKIEEIDSLLGEAISVRVEKDMVNDPTVQALVLTDIVSVTLESYSEAYGVGSSHDHTGMEMSDHSSMESSDQSSPGMQSAEIVNEAAYQSAKAFSDKAVELFTKLQPLAPAGSTGAMSAAASGILRLQDSIARKEPLDVVTVIVHGQIHENLKKAFNLQLETLSPPIALEVKSTSGTYVVHVDWSSNEIGKENVFDINITDTDGNKIDGATYDIMLYKDGEHLDSTHRASQMAAEQKYTFDEPGNYTLRIEQIDKTGEMVEIPIQVTPEFPVSMMAVLSAVLGGAILAGRKKF